MGYEWREVKRKGIDILFAVDTSRSMLAEDLTPNRLDRARLGILDFVARLEGDRVGLIPFAGSAFALCPLTLDYDAFRESLDALDTDLIPKQGTDLASAIREAERLFEEKGNNHRILVLLTDGEDLQGDVIDAAKKAAENGMAIYTIGVGSPEGATIPIRHRNGRTDYVRDRSGEVVRTTLDEGTLRKIAEATNALYVPLGRGAEGLNTIYQEKLRLVPKSEMDQRMERIPLERFEWPLGAALALFVLEFLIGDRRRAAARIPKARAAAAALIAVFALSGLRLHGAEDPRLIYNQGTAAYESGDFGEAAEALRDSLRTQDLSLQQRAYYNLGNTLYRTGQGTLETEPQATIKSWEASIKAFEDALALNASDEDAKYNKEFVERKLEELKQQQQQENKDQSDEQKDQSEEQKDQSEEQKDQSEEQKDQSEEQKEQSEEQKDQSEEQKEQSEEQKDQSEEQKEGGQPEEEERKENKDAQEGDEQKPEQEPSGKPGEENENKEQQGDQQAEGVPEERGEKKEMSPEEARRLLEALRGDERTVIPIPPPQQGRLARPDNTTKGKTW
jgi:Ca-activated chloride channel homolog